MPQRTISLLLALTGLLTVAALGLTSCERGGNSGGTDSAATDSAAKTTGPTVAAIPTGQKLADTTAWKHLAATWAEAEEIGSGQRGDYPFDEAGKQRLLDELDGGSADLNALAAAGLLTDTETALLQKCLADVVTGVQRQRATETKKFAYYLSLYIPPARVALQNLADRRPLLEKLAAGGAVHGEALDKIVPAVESDLKVLADETALEELRPEERAKVETLRKQVEAQVKALNRAASAGSISAMDPFLAASHKQAVKLS